MIEFIAEHINTVSTLISALAALLTAVATFFLWRVTRLLADETKRMVDASVQPHVVVTLEPNSWAAFILISILLIPEMPQPMILKSDLIPHWLMQNIEKIKVYHLARLAY